jgi:hypothetical protein
MMPSPPVEASGLDLAVDGRCLQGGRTAIDLNRSQLLQDTKQIGLRPVFDDLTVLKPDDQYARVRDASPPRRDAMPVSKVSAFTAITDGEAIVFLNLVLNGDTKIWKRRQEASERRLKCPRPSKLHAWINNKSVGREEPVECSKVSAVKDCFHKVPERGLVIVL